MSFRQKAVFSAMLLIPLVASAQQKTAPPSSPATAVKACSKADMAKIPAERKESLLWALRGGLQLGQPNVVAKALAACADPDGVSPVSIQGLKPFNIGILMGISDAESVRLLAASGVDFEKTDPASGEKNPQIREILVRPLPQAQATVKQWLANPAASEFFMAKFADATREFGLELDKTDTFKSFHWDSFDAASAEAARLMPKNMIARQYATDIPAATNPGKNVSTPLEWAVYGGHPDAVKIMLSRLDRTERDALLNPKPAGDISKANKQTLFSNTPLERVTGISCWVPRETADDTRAALFDALVAAGADPARESVMNLVYLKASPLERLLMLYPGVEGKSVEMKKLPADVLRKARNRAAEMSALTKRTLGNNWRVVWEANQFFPECASGGKR